MSARFPKIWQLGTPQASRLFNGPVEITEKIDGSAFNFGWQGDTFTMLSKGGVVLPGTTDKLFAPVAEWALSLRDKLPKGVMFHGETLMRPKHNILTYDRVPKNNFILYGVSDNQDRFWPWPNLSIFARELLDCDVVPLLHLGDMTAEAFRDMVPKWLDTESCLGKAKMEGVVIKNHAEQLLIGGMTIPILCGKYVSEAFKEKHKVEWISHGGELQAYFNSFRTEARFAKAVQHLREAGVLKGAPQDIPDLYKELGRDFMEEEEARISKWLWDHHKKDILKRVSAGLAEWYKDQLLKQQS